MRWTQNGHILITGATQRVGLYCAERLLDAGERLVLTYRRPKPVVEGLRQRGAICIAADFDSPQSIANLVDTLHRDVGPLRAIVHNASCWPQDQTPGTDLYQVLDAVLAVHVRAPYLLNRQCEDLLRRGASPWADVVHITDYVVEKGSENHIAYAASKAAMANLTLSFAKRLAPVVKVNSLAPSLLMFNDGDSPEYRERTLRKSLLGVEPGPGVIFDALAYLFDNPYMTGREIRLDGGRHLR